MTGNDALKIGGLLLAAGSSSRLGRPKQLVKFGGKTLIRRSGEMLSTSVCDPITVVLGAEIEGSTRELEGLDI
ncbi:MAG TPA: NTP transferase domain-containing protein, partial [Pyrinomonadaceae bacterium]|nr:NTP transferase domain-containing protein [Pyrinomonadaceae bacterium]